MQKSPLYIHQNSSTSTPYTMSSSTSAIPQVEPPTTIKTKSSFSEIEQFVEPHPPIKNHSFVPPQLQIHQQTEPFVSPLTETNLNYHKSTFPPSREAKQRYVDSFIQNQKVLLEQELELQRKTKAEIQSMIPLDTKSIDEELVRDDEQLWNRILWPLPPTSQNQMPFGTARRRHSTLAHHRFSNNREEQALAFQNSTENEQQSTQQIDGDTKLQQTSSSKKPWMKNLTRWIRLGQTKKHDDCDGNNLEQQHQHQHQQQQPSVVQDTVPAIPQQGIENVDLHADPTVSSSSAPVSATPASDARYGIYRQVNQQQERKAARHVSWSGGTSFERYKQQKSSMIEEGLYGLSNANIARALGSSQQGSKAPFLFFPPRNSTSSSASHTTHLPSPPSMHIPTPTPTPDLHEPADSNTSSSSSTHQKRDPNLSFVQQTLSSAKSLLRPRKSIRKKSNHVDPQETTQQQYPTDNSNNDDEHDGSGGDRTGTDSYGDNTLQQQPQHQYQQQQQYPAPSEQEKEKRRRSTHVNGRYSPSLSALKEEEWVGVTGSCQGLVAFRYPKMVRIKDLRDAAIHILSTSDAGGGGGGGGDGSSGDDDNDAMDYMAIVGRTGGDRRARNRSQWKTEHDDLSGSDDDLDMCERRYGKSIKRFSYPGTGLSAPPFSIGRPMSSLYY